MKAHADGPEFVHYVKNCIFSTPWKGHHQVDGKTGVRGHANGPEFTHYITIQIKVESSWLD